MDIQTTQLNEGQGEVSYIAKDIYEVATKGRIAALCMGIQARELNKGQGEVSYIAKDTEGRIALCMDIQTRELNKGPGEVSYTAKDIYKVATKGMIL